MSSLLLLSSPKSCKLQLSQQVNVSKGDFPMALLPDPTTAASERSSVKNKLTGSRRRGSGINRHRSRTFSKTSLRGVQAQGAGASRESRRGSRRVQERSGGVQG